MFFLFLFFVEKGLVREYERVGIEVGFGHPSFIGIDLLSFKLPLTPAWTKLMLASTLYYQSFLKEDEKV